MAGLRPIGLGFVFYKQNEVEDWSLFGRKVNRGSHFINRIWEEAVKGDLKGWSTPKDLTLNRSAWKQLSMCMNFDLHFLLGFNSNLPNLIRTKRLHCRYTYMIALGF